MTLAPDQLHVLQHSLGCDEHGQTSYAGDSDGDHCFGRYHRNRFFTDPGCSDGQVCVALVAAGLMQDHGPQRLAGDMHLYSVTRAGVEAMRAQSPKPPKLTAGQRRYREFLDADCGMAFGEWLKARAAYERDGARTWGWREVASA